MIRDATVDDCATLTALAIESKAFWGYDDAFMTACRDELTIRPADLARGSVRLYEDGGEILGFHGVIDGELLWMFVAPRAMRHGIGGALLADAREIASTRGLRELRIDADPFAAPFYEAAGAVLVGETPSLSIPGRALPTYVLDVSSIS